MWRLDNGEPQINFNLLICNSRLHLSFNLVGVPAGKLTELQAEDSGESEEEPLDVINDPKNISKKRSDSPEFLLFFFFFENGIKLRV